MNIRSGLFGVWNTSTDISEYSVLAETEEDIRKLVSTVDVQMAENFMLEQDALRYIAGLTETEEELLVDSRSSTHGCLVDYAKDMARQRVKTRGLCERRRVRKRSSTGCGWSGT